jgi:hypothetical protein
LEYKGGGSIATWLDYFPSVQVVGIDNDATCKQFEQNGAKIYIGSQEDSDFLRDVEKKEGPFDIVIDDGGHTMKQQITSFSTLYPLLKDDGMYVIEDLHTSYWNKFGGGKYFKKTTIKRIKDLIDDMHYWATDHPRVNIFWRIKHKLTKTRKGKAKNVFQETVRSIHIADSICFIRKGILEKDVVNKI